MPLTLLPGNPGKTRYAAPGQMRGAMRISVGMDIGAVQRGGAINAARRTPPDQTVIRQPGRRGTCGDGKARERAFHPGTFCAIRIVGPGSKTLCGRNRRKGKHRIQAAIASEQRCIAALRTMTGRGQAFDPLKNPAEIPHHAAPCLSSSVSCGSMLRRRFKPG